MQRALTQLQRVTLERHAPLVPCCTAANREERWRRLTESCGAMIPYRPSAPCPVCQRPQARAQAPLPGPDSLVLPANTAVIDAASGEVVVVYVVCANDIASRLMTQLRDVEFDKDVYWNVKTTTRLSGVAVTHRTFGYQPPQPIRRRYGCSRSQFNTDHPEATATLGEFCRLAEHVFRTHATEVFESTTEAVLSNIGVPWRIVGTPWTSGIINQTAALPYHTDKGNVPRSWSAMLGARHNVADGYLHLADYNCYLPVEHGSISIFDGQSVVHGVTPMRVTGSHAQRVTVVVYAKNDMCKCSANPADEARRAAIEATFAEDRRLNGHRPTRSS